MPALYPIVKRKMPTVKEEGWDVVGGFTLRKNVDVIPQPGIQEEMARCEANVIFACGDATMGKTFGGFIRAISGIGLPNYTARLVSGFLQDFKSESSLVRDMKVIYDGYAGCKFSAGEYPVAYFPQWNNTIKGIHMNFNTANPDEWVQCQEYLKSNQAIYFYWDEITKIKDERVFLYSLSRNRDASGLSPCSCCTFNPKKKHWTYEWLNNAGYIDNSGALPYLRKDMIGKLKYFYIKGNYVKDIVWGSTPQEVLDKCDVKLTDKDIEAGLTPEMMVKSFTVLSGEAADNHIMVHATRGGSIANLHAVGQKHRESLKGGAFIDEEESENLTVSQKVIESIFDNPSDTSSEMYASLDVSGGESESDNCPMWIWKGHTAIALEMFYGTLKELEGWIQTMLARYNVPISHFCFDAKGVGFYLKSYTTGRPIISNARAVQEYDEAGNPVTIEQFFNLRSQLMGKLSVLLNTGEISCTIDRYARFPYGKKGTSLPLIDILFNEINVFATIKKGNNKTYYLSKEEFKDRYKYSPGIIDAMIYRAIFDLDTKPKKDVEPEITEEDYLRGLYASNGKVVDINYFSGLYKTY